VVDLSSQEIYFLRSLRACNKSSDNYKIRSKICTLSEKTPTNMQKNWKIIATDSNIVADLTHQLSIHTILCTLLVQRGITNFEQARQFFRSSTTQLHDPFLMSDMQNAVGRLKIAIEKQERILLFGDYDVDGVSCIALAHRFLQPIHSHLEYYTPNRYIEGYGFSETAVDYAKQNDISLIIVMDCGTSAHAAVARAKKNGIDCIICDHHEPENTLPNGAIAILNPKRKDCAYPYKDLSACGVVFKLLSAFSEGNEAQKAKLFDLLDIVALSTACDVMPITGENRILVHLGMKILNEIPKIGIQQLIQNARRTSPLSVSDLVFGLGPRINAAGRLSDAQTAVRLLLTNSAPVAADIAQELERRNDLRKKFEQKIQEEAENMLVAIPNFLEMRAFILYQSHWHKGILGIVAAHLAEKWHRPVALLTESNGVAVGSMRSANNINIHEVLEKCTPVLRNFGGHHHAAGLALPTANIAQFQQLFLQSLAEMPETMVTLPTLQLSAIIHLKEITSAFLNILQQFAPFGPKNMNPVFGTKRVFLIESKILKEKHLQMRIQQDNSPIFSCIAFEMAHLLPSIETEPFYIAYSIETVLKKGAWEARLKIKDIRVR
jgi:single-stranded-DNA-specific exonuclease